MITSKLAVVIGNVCVCLYSRPTAAELRAAAGRVAKEGANNGNTQSKPKREPSCRGSEVFSREKAKRKWVIGESQREQSVNTVTFM